MQLRFFDYCFQPGWAATVAVLLLLPALLAMGFWQISRGQEKAELLAAYTARAAQPPMLVTQAAAEIATFTRVELHGRYDSEHQFLLDNRVRNGRVGFEVLTPFRLIDDAGWLLVNRGWIQGPVPRGPKPEITVTEQTLILTGLVTRPQKGFALGDMSQAQDTWPRIVQFVNYPAMARLLEVANLQTYVVQLAADETGVLDADWQPLPFGPEKHYGYAVQWFALAVTLLLLYLIVNIRKAYDDTHTHTH